MSRTSCTEEQRCSQNTVTFDFELNWEEEEEIKFKKTTSIEIEKYILISAINYDLYF